MESNELASARARRAAAALERLLGEIEAGDYGLGPDRRHAVTAHIRRTLGAYREATGDNGRGSPNRSHDRRANG